MSKKKAAPVDWKARVTKELTEFIDTQDTLPWLKPWSNHGIFPTNLQTKHEYRGINALLLGMMMGVRGYEDPYFLTIDGMKKLGGSFADWDTAKDRGLPIVFWKMLRVEDKNNPGEMKTVPLLKGWTVWNVAHMTGIEVPERRTALIVGDGIEQMEANYANPPQIEHIPSTQAYYSPLFDRITLPLKNQFDTELGYGETKAHELVHSTGHTSRLARFDDKSEPHGERYAREELVAEIGAMILLQRLGYTPDTRRAADYVRGWGTRIKDDPLMLISAANRADKAVNMVLGIAQEQEVAA